MQELVGVGHTQNFGLYIQFKGKAFNKGVTQLNLHSGCCMKRKYNGNKQGPTREAYKALNLDAKFKVLPKQ